MGLMEFQRRFRAETACRKHLFKLRWPGGFKCPRCGHGECFDLPKRKHYQCKSCDHQTSVTAGTVMHRTRTPLRKWFWAIFLTANDKRGRGTSKVPVMIEAATFEGGKGGRGLGFARMRVVDGVDGTTVESVIGEDVAAGQKIVTDGWPSYNVVGRMGHEHVRKVSGKEANADLKWAHILASNSKAFLLGTFHGISRKHLQSYLDEFCYRFNRRQWEDELFDRLVTACATSSGVTYSELTA